MNEIIKKTGKRILSSLTLDFTDTLQYTGSRFSEIRKNIFLGSRPCENSVEELKQRGITRIVSCMDEGSEPDFDFLGEKFDHLFLELHDGIYEDIQSRLITFFDFIQGRGSGRPGGNLFVHCESGVSRSAALVTALIMREEKRRFIEAFMSSISILSGLQCQEKERSL